MTTGWRGSVLAVAAIVPLVGCVDRRFVVETNTPGAQITLDGVPIGPSPTDGRWEYAGCYEFTAVAPGHEPLVQMVKFEPKWYQYPPWDFFAEVVYPFRIEDVRRVRLRLEPTRPVDQAALVGAANALRSRGATLPPSSVPDTPQQHSSAIPAPPGSRNTPVPSNAGSLPPVAAPLSGQNRTTMPDAMGIPPAVVPGNVLPPSGPSPERPPM